MCILMRMKAMVEDLRKEALGLPVSERASLAHELILSLDDRDSFALDAKTEAEIGRRVKMVRDGKAKGRPTAAVFRDIEAKYG